MTGDAKLQTYRLYLEFTRQRSILRNELRKLFEEADMKFYYDLNQEGISYLFDADDDFISNLNDIKSQTDENVTLEQVKSLTEQDKHMMTKL